MPNDLSSVQVAEGLVRGAGCGQAGGGRTASTGRGRGQEEEEEESRTCRDGEAAKLSSKLVLLSQSVAPKHIWKGPDGYNFIRDSVSIEEIKEKN